MLAFWLTHVSKSLLDVAADLWVRGRMDSPTGPGGTRPCLADHPNSLHSWGDLGMRNSEEM